MKKIFKTPLLIISAISFICLLIIFPFLIYAEIAGAGGLTRLFERISIPLTYNQFWIISHTFFAIIIITEIMLKKIYKENWIFDRIIKRIRDKKD